MLSCDHLIVYYSYSKNKISQLFLGIGTSFVYWFIISGINTILRRLEGIGSIRLVTPGPELDSNTPRHTVIKLQLVQYFLWSLGEKWNNDWIWNNLNYLFCSEDYEMSRSNGRPCFSDFYLGTQRIDRQHSGTNQKENLIKN